MVTRCTTWRRWSPSNAGMISIFLLLQHLTKRECAEIIINYTSPFTYSRGSLGKMKRAAREKFMVELAGAGRNENENRRKIRKKRKSLKVFFNASRITWNCIFFFSLSHCKSIRIERKRWGLKLNEVANCNNEIEFSRGSSGTRMWRMVQKSRSQDGWEMMTRRGKRARQDWN